MWFVEYEVEGFGKQKAGPWPLPEALEQKADIEGYAGVSNVALVPEEAVVAAITEVQ